MDLFEALETTRAIRRFTDAPVTDDEILTCIRAAVQAPSGGNIQPWQFVVVTDPAVKRALGDVYRRAYDRYVAGDLAAARAAFDHFTPLAHWRRQFPLLGAKEVLRRQGIFKAAHLREPAAERLDDQDQRELAAIMERMGPPY